MHSQPLLGRHSWTRWPSFTNYERKEATLMYQDKTLTCQDCSQSFTFSADDQQYHAEKGFTNEPKRCSSCRQSRRAGRDGGGGGYSSGRREMFPATCAQGGKEAQVPFEPR